MYFPKSQIITDLYTNGNEFIFPNTTNEYVGNYFQTSDGKFYTGKNPNDPPIREIIKSEGTPTQDVEEQNINSYTTEAGVYLVPEVYAFNTKLNVNASPPSPPIQVINLPTEKNYNLGEFQRYFASKNNEIKYTEIDLKQFNKFQNEEPDVDFNLYKVFSLPWLISGNRNDVTNVNQKTIQRIAKNFNLPGFPSYFNGKLDQYFRYQIGENLKTDGTEFIVESTRRPYIGLYHVHPTKGPMVGAQHVPFPHEFLIPISGSNQQNRVDRVETQTSNNRGSIGYGGGY